MAKHKARNWTAIFTENWNLRLISFFTLLFILQFVSWFASETNFWWPETVTVVKVSLAVVFLLELIPRLNRWLLRCVELWVLLGINAIYNSYEPVLYKVRSLKDFSNWVYDNFWQLHPFVWFSLGAWAVYLAACWWMRARWRIGVALGAAVLVLAVRDSFSLLTLWDETAMVILSGLMLLVVCHFSEIKRQNPAGWTYMMEYPATLLVMISVMLAVMMIPGTLAPNVRPLLTDPYTAYLEWKGREAPAFGKGFLGGDLLFPTGNASSGYSRDDSSLGGGFDFDFAPVFTVDTTQRSYWRGETRSGYTGSGWQQSDGDKQASSMAITADNTLNRENRLFDTSRLKTVTVRQTVGILSETESYPVLFGAFSVSKVISVNGEKAIPDRLRWSPRQNELRWNESGRGSYPQIYTIESEVPAVPDKELKSVSNPPNLSQFGEYLQLPKSLPARVRQLAQDVTAEGSTPYEKAKMLERYLQMNYPYTNQPRVERGTSEDFVDRFLFEIREGYCDYFSTAMAVLSRSLDIPARWVKGYVSGFNEYEDTSFTQVPLDIMRNPDAGGSYTVRNSDAHSWVELYFHGYGWIPFEATSGFALPDTVQEEGAEAVPLPAVTPLTEASAPVAEEKEPAISRTVVIAIVSAGAVVLIALLAGWLYRSGLLQAITWRGKPILGQRASNPRQRVITEYGKLIRRFRRRGFVVYEHETARETIVRLKKRSSWMSEDLDHLLLLFEKAKYSPRDVTQEESGKAEEIVEKLKKAI